jgi:phospholipase/lecithinase/hemolysin
MGGDDIRDAVVLGNPGIIGNAIAAIGQNVTTLYLAGARKFLIWNAPNIGLTPAISIAEQLQPGAIAAATGLSLAFNSGLDGLFLSLGQLPEIQIMLDIYALLNAMVPLVLIRCESPA